MDASSLLSRSPHWGFAAFGVFWGVWGASIPRIREQAGITDAELGIALLFVGAGALPSMLLIGRALDRWGLWLTGPLLVALGVAGLLLATNPGRSLLMLCVAFAIVGATSGAADVALNSLAGRVEQLAGRPVITPSHASFSIAVVAATLSTGAIATTGAVLMLPFALAGLATVIACIAIVRVARSQHAPEESDTGGPATGGMPTPLLIGIGLLGALAFAGENAHQSWSAVFLEDELSAPAGLSAFGPAVFAGVVAITRLSVSRLDTRHARALLIVGAAVATAGAALLAFAPTLPLALAALALAAAGGAVLFPTLLGIVSRAVPEERRGRATSAVTVVAYTGFLAGPAYVGLTADLAGLRGAMIAVGALTALMALLIPVVLRERRLARIS